MGCLLDLFRQPVEDGYFNLTNTVMFLEYLDEEKFVKNDKMFHGNTDDEKILMVKKQNDINRRKKSEDENLLDEPTIDCNESKSDEERYLMKNKNDVNRCKKSEDENLLDEPTIDCNESTNNEAHKVPLEERNSIGI